MTEAALLMMELLKSEIFGSEINEEYKKPISEEMGKALYALSRAHDMAPAVASALEKTRILPEGETLEKFKKAMHLAVYRYRVQNAELIAVSELLEEKGIDYMPLKGAVIRKLYPSPWQRTSSDIDILVRPEDLESAAEAITLELEYEKKGRTAHDIVLSAPSGASVELHFDLVEEARLPEAADILKSVWERASLDGGSHRYSMSDEMFYFYHIAHMAKHFENGGCGVRPFIDLVLLGEENGEKREELLAKGGLWDFAKAARELCGYWFFSKESSGVISDFSRFILSGGVYGTAENGVAASGAKRGKAGYIFSRLFLPFSTLKERYPVLKKHPWLMPAMQVRRWLEMVKDKRLGRSIGELKMNASLDKSRAKQVDEMFRGVGLR